MDNKFDPKEFLEKYGQKEEQQTSNETDFDPKSFLSEYGTAEESSSDDNEQSEMDITQPITIPSGVVAKSLAEKIIPGEKITKAGEKLIDFADELRFSRAAKQGRASAGRFLEGYLENVGEAFLSPQDLGAKMRSEGISGVFSTEKGDLEKAKKLAREAQIEKAEFLENLDKQYKKIGSRERVAQDFGEFAEKKLGQVEGEKQLEKVTKKIDKLMEAGPARLSDLELEKSNVGFKQDATDLTKKIKNIQRAAYRKETERAISELPEGKKLLKEFRDIKKNIATGGVLSDMAAEAAKKDILGPSMPKGITEEMYGAAKAFGSRLIDPVTHKAGQALKLAGKAIKPATKLLPPVAAALGAYDTKQTYDELIEKGVSPEKASVEAGIRGFSPVPVDWLESGLEYVAPETYKAYEEKLQEFRGLKKEIPKLETKEQVTSALDKLRSKDDSASQMYADTLEKAISPDGKLQKSVLFSLQQQPAFRQLIKKLDNEPT